MISHWLGYAWDAVAIWFVLSVASAPVFLLVRKARARSRRLFVDGPTGRIKALSADTRIDHKWDGA